MHILLNQPLHGLKLHVIGQLFLSYQHHVDSCMCKWNYLSCRCTKTDVSGTYLCTKCYFLVTFTHGEYVVDVKLV